MAAMTGIKTSLLYYCLAGAAITSCGWLDVLLYVCTRRVLVFSQSPPARDDFGFDTLGFRHGGQFFGITTTIEGPLTRKPRSRRKSRDHLGRMFPKSLRRRRSDEDYFAYAAGGVIATKTTVEVSTGPIPLYAQTQEPQYIDAGDQESAASDFSVIELEDQKAQGIQSPVTSHLRWREDSSER